MGIVTQDKWVKGTYNSISDDSGQKYKRKDMRKTWDNKLVGIDEWEPKQPQLTIRSYTDRQIAADARSDATSGVTAGPALTTDELI
jgi:hypothetical protein